MGSVLCSGGILFQSGTFALSLLPETFLFVASSGIAGVHAFLEAGFVPSVIDLILQKYTFASISAS